MTIMKAAAAQISPVLYGRKGTVDKVVQKIIEFGRQDVQFASFGEALLPYYLHFSVVRRSFEMGAYLLKLMDEAVTVPSAVTMAAQRGQSSSPEFFFEG
jgi:aliphatic nitrilase